MATWHRLDELPELPAFLCRPPEPAGRRGYFRWAAHVRAAWIAAGAPPDVADYGWGRLIAAWTWHPTVVEARAAAEQHRADSLAGLLARWAAHRARLAERTPRASELRRREGA